MNPVVAFMVTAGLGLLAQALAIYAIIWRGGQVVGELRSSKDFHGEELRMLRIASGEHAVMMARLGALLDGVEKRVGALEARSR